MWEDKIRDNPDTIKAYMSSSEINLFNNYYTGGLYWALQLIAWEQRNLTRVCVILTKFSKYDKKATDYIAGILLPWYPQTKASIDSRKSAINNVIKEDDKVGWKVLLELMPNKKTIGSPSHTPKWNNLLAEKEEQPQVLNVDYYKQIKNYLEILIKHSKTDVERLCNLIDLLDDVPKDMFEMILQKLSQKSIKQLSDDKKYILWNHLENFINRHIKFSDAKWSFPKTILNKIKKLSRELKPSSKLVYNQRYFIKDSWTLYDDRVDYKKSEKELYELRVKIIKEILALGFDKVIDFINEVEEPYIVGMCLSEVIDDSENEEKALNYLDSKKEKEVLFARGFVFQKFKNNGYDWINGFDIKSWSTDKKLNFLIVLPSNQKTWDLVSEFLNDEQIKYWEIADLRFIDEEANINYPMEKLLEAGRPAKAIGILDLSLRHGKGLDYDRNLSVKALNEILAKQDELNSLDMYHIRDVIKDLQESEISRDEMFHIEWAYLNLLDSHYEKDTRPITIEKEMSKNPERFNEILSLAYKKHSLTKEEAEVVDEKIATNAYKLLHLWRIPPGLDETGKINKNQLNNWYKEMKKTCEKSDRLEVGLMMFGHVLYYSPEDKSGLWIDKNVAEILNAEDSNIILDGFKNEAFNSLGAINIDPEGAAFDNIANKYEEKAKSIEEAGYSRIATAMRGLSDSYRHQAEKTRETYYDYD